MRSAGLFVAGALLAALPAVPVLALSPAPTPDPAFVDEAAGAYLARLDTGADPGKLDALAAAGTLDFGAHPRELGRLWVQEIVMRAGEPSFRRRAAEEAAGGGETPRRALARLVTDAARADGRALLRAAVRLYATHWTEASPSRLRLFDLEAGALDAAPPAPMTVRHRSYVPERDADAIRLAWPLDGGDGAAVVRYDDTGLPPDVVFFSPGDVRSIPLSGVVRIDFVVAGSEMGTNGVEAPVDCTRESSPFWRLDARAEATSGGPRLIWTTASHEGLRGWAIFREEVSAVGSLLMCVV
jgi:hypothetical protein